MKTITMTIAQLRDAVPALQEIGAMKLPAAAAYRISRALQTIEDHLATYRKTLDRLLTEHGADKSGDQAEFETPEKKAEFLAEAKQLDQEEIEIAIKRVAVDQITAPISAHLFMQADFLFYEEDEEPGR